MRPGAGVAAAALAFGLSLVMSAPSAAAHDVGAGIEVRVGAEAIGIRQHLPFEAAGLHDDDGDGLIDVDEIARQRAEARDNLAESLRIAVDGHDVAVTMVDFVLTGLAASDTVTVDVRGDSVHDDPDTVALHWPLAPAGTPVTVVRPAATTTASLGADGDVSASFDGWHTVTAFVALGIDHIVRGPDHLLFLGVLTLTATGAATDRFTRSARRLAKLALAFTIGHGVSLAVAWAGWVTVSPRLVEPMIAVSIAALALTVRPGRSVAPAAWTVAAVGAVHGLGFAGSLADLGVAAPHQVLALASFNLGVDLAQTAAVTLFAGALAAARVMGQRPMDILRLAAAFSAAAVALVWTGERLAL